MPSLFFIGRNGTPIEIVTGVTKTVDELNSKIDGVLNGMTPNSSNSNSANASANLIASKNAKQKSLKCFFGFLFAICSFFLSGEQSASNEKDTEIVCENGVCYKRPKENKTESATTEDTASVSTSNVSNEEKLNRAKELIEKKRKEKDEEDARVS